MSPTLIHSSKIACSLIVGAAMVSACDRREDSRTAGQKLDQVTAQVGQKADEFKANARDAASNANDAVANKSHDLAITTEINAKLSRDERLSPLNINVDTAEGRVILRGSAPDTSAREHATDLARSVEGVVDVNNQLNVQPRP